MWKRSKRKYEIWYRWGLKSRRLCTPTQWTEDSQRPPGDSGRQLSTPEKLRNPLAITEQPWADWLCLRPMGTLYSSGWPTDNPCTRHPTLYPIGNPWFWYFRIDLLDTWHILTLLRATASGFCEARCLRRDRRYEGPRSCHLSHRA